MNNSTDLFGGRDKLQNQLDTAVAELQQTPFGRGLLELWEDRPKPGDDFVAYSYEQDEELRAYSGEALGAAEDGQVWDLFESMAENFRFQEQDQESDGDRVSPAMLAWLGSNTGFLKQFHSFQVKIYPMMMSREGFVPGLSPGEQLRVARLASSIHSMIWNTQNPSGLDPYDEFA